MQSNLPANEQIFDVLSSRINEVINEVHDDSNLHIGTETRVAYQWKERLKRRIEKLYEV